MAWAFKSKTDRSFGYTDTIGLTAPASIAAGDVLVAVIWIGWFGYTWNSPPSGWTKRIDKPNTAYGSFSVFTKTATGSESGTINFVHNNVNTAPGFGAMLCYSGVNTATPLDAHASSGLISNIVMPAPSVTAGANGKLLICNWVNGNSVAQSDIDEPASMTNRVDRYDTAQLEGFRSLCIADEAVAGGGATGVRNGGQNSANNGTALSFTLNEAAAAASTARSFAVIAG